MSAPVNVLAVMDRGIVFADRTGSSEDSTDAREARAAAKELRDAAEAVCERGTDSPLWQRLEAALVRFDGAQP